MSRRVREFAQVDVFAATPYLGNPVAVILHGEGTSVADMQRVARWANLSETVFVLPPTKAKADYRLRIFTPSRELPFAGHPTLGAAHAWLENGGVPRDPGVIVQECEAGLVEIRAKHDSLSFAAPPTLRTGPLDEPFLADIAAALRIDRQDIQQHQWVDNGPGWAAVRLSSAEEVLALEPDLARIPDAKLGVIGAHPEGSEHAYETRAFAPGAGIPEDPVTGSLNAAVAQWLIRDKAAPSSFRVSQGSRVGRAGSIHIAADHNGGVWVGGRTNTLVRGTITL